jgi:hypothetical protein
MLPLKQNNSVEVRIDEVEDRVLIVELLRLEQMQENAAVEGEFGNKHLRASRKRQGWGGVLEGLSRPGQVHPQTVPLSAESFICDLEGFEVRKRRKGDALKQLLLLLLSSTPKKMSVEGLLQFVLVETDPGCAELVAVLPSEAGRLHDAADDGGVEQFLQGSRSDVITQASGRRMAELACEQEVRRSVELGELVKLVGIEIAKVDLSPRWGRPERQTGFRVGKVLQSVQLLIRLIFLPTARITTRRHFFCKRESSRAALMKSLRTSNGCCEVITVDK